MVSCQRRGKGIPCRASHKRLVLRRSLLRNWTPRECILCEIVMSRRCGNTSLCSYGLDRDFPSLSNNQPQPSQSTWAIAGSRNTGQPANVRLQQPQQAQQQQDELFSAGGQQLPGSGMGFRFGGSNNAAQSAQTNTGTDDFPPLNNRGTSGDIGQDRGLSHGFGGQSNGIGFGAPAPPQPTRNGSNGLLNALSGSNRGTSVNRAASPSNASGDYAIGFGVNLIDFANSRLIKITCGNFTSRTI